MLTTEQEQLPAVLRLPRPEEAPVGAPLPDGVLRALPGEQASSRLGSVCMGTSGMF